MENFPHFVGAGIIPAAFCFVFRKPSFEVRGDAGVDASVRTAQEIYKIRRGLI